MLVTRHVGVNPRHGAWLWTRSPPKPALIRRASIAAFAPRKSCWRNYLMDRNARSAFRNALPLGGIYIAALILIQALEPRVLRSQTVWGGMGGWALAPPQFTREPLLTVRAFFVVSPQHPLATHRATIPPTILGEHIQLVHVDITDLAQAGRPGLLSPKVWRLSHLGAKLAFLRAGLGFGLMPLHMIEADLASGALVPIRGESAPPEGYVIAMSAVYRTDSPPGPAGRWFIDRLKQEDARWLNEKAPLSAAAAAKPQRPPSRSLTMIRSLSGAVPAVNR